MKNLQESSTVEPHVLTALIAQWTKSSPATIQPFAEFVPFLTELLRRHYKTGCRLLSAGHVGPDIEVAADRAAIELMENIGPSPFSGSLEAVLANVNCPHDIIYVANPNRITGANYSFAELKTMAEAVPQGLLLIDEYYHEFFGISGPALLDEHSNVILLRTLTTPSTGSNDSGYVIARPETIAALKDITPADAFPSAILKDMQSKLTDDEAAVARLREVHEESLRLAVGLTRLGAQSRITATDFILIRVAHPVQVGNWLTRAKIQIDNLDGYPAMKHYLRYRIQSPLTNDRLLQAFQGMPPESIQMTSLDRRSMALRLNAHTAQPVSALNSTVTRIAERHLFDMAECDTELVKGK